MGRPPIGKAAMSAAERQRRHRAQFRDSKPVTKPAQPDVAKDREIDVLKKHVADLEAKLASRGTKPEPRPLPRTAAELAAAKQQAQAARKAKLAAGRAAARAAAGLVVEEPETIEGVKAELDNVLAQLKSARTRIKNQGFMINAIATEATKRTQLVTSERLFREINFLIHPDRQDSAKAKERAHKCLAEFNGLSRKLYKE
jgi:hypothetical protein